MTFGYNKIMMDGTFVGKVVLYYVPMSILFYDIFFARYSFAEITHTLIFTFLHPSSLLITASSVEPHFSHNVPPGRISIIFVLKKKVAQKGRLNHTDVGILLIPGCGLYPESSKCSRRNSNRLSGGFRRVIFGNSRSSLASIICTASN